MISNFLFQILNKKTLAAKTRKDASAKNRIFPTEIRFHKEISLDILQETKSMG